MNTCLIALDLEEGTKTVAEHGMALASALGWRPVLLHVDEHASRFSRLGMSAEELGRMARRYRSSAEQHLRDLALEIGGGETLEVLTTAGRTDESIVAEAASRQAACIVLGAHRRDRTARILGHNVLRVVRNAGCPVYTASVARPFSRPERIVHATDLGDEGRDAARFAAFLAGSFGAELVLVHVPAGLDESVPAYVLSPELRAAHRTSSESALAALADEMGSLAASYRDGPSRVRHRLAAARDEAMSLLEAAREERADVLVLGTHGRQGISRVLLGSVAERVLQRAECAVVTVRHREDAPT